MCRRSNCAPGHSRSVSLVGHARSLFRGLLTHNPLQRLGCRQNGARDVKAHRWFNAFDFDALLARQLPPPYVPPVRDALDTSCFDEYELPDDDLLFLDASSEGESAWDAAF